ncbi:MAG TPA: DUF4349 domain-containing protein [Candidatus Sulfotelmatobacter sp.]|nr:DUF4349 domain-containing protein [Candidatus Sulfotelmatobacter sp.]
MKKLLVVVAILVGAAACGGAESAGSTAATSNGTTVAPQGGNLSAGGGATKTNGSGGGATTGGTTVPSQTVPTLQGPPVIRQAQLSVTVSSGSFDSKLSQVRTLVEAAGGYIAGTDAQAGGSTGSSDNRIRTAVVNFMVPANQFDSTIDQLSKVGTVQSEHITGTDVSAQYVDLRARLVNAEAQHDAMLALLKQATNINDIIAVQNQIGQITAQIEQLKGQIKYLDDNTSYSSITVTLAESGAPVSSTTPDSWGFATALSQAAHNFVTTLNYFVSGLGAIGPFVVVGLLGYIVWRRRRTTPLPRHA